MKTYSREAFALSLRVYGCNCESCRTSASLLVDDDPAPESGDSDGDSGSDTHSDDWGNDTEGSEE